MRKSWSDDIDLGRVVELHAAANRILGGTPGVTAVRVEYIQPRRAHGYRYEDMRPSANGRGVYIGGSGPGC